MTMLTKAKLSIQKFHRDEDGLEALQIVMIIAVAAVALIFVKNNWETNIKPWVDKLIQSIITFDESKAAAS